MTVNFRSQGEIGTIWKRKKKISTGDLTFTLAILFPKYCTFFNRSEWCEHHPDVVFCAFFRQHPYEQLPFLYWNASQRTTLLQSVLCSIDVCIRRKATE